MIKIEPNQYAKTTIESCRIFFGYYIFVDMFTKIQYIVNCVMENINK